MDELTIGDKIYISSKRAAAITGYAKDYVGQLCREGHVEAKMVGRSWYVLESSIRAHRFGKPEERSEEVPEVSERETVATEALISATVESIPEIWEASKYVPEEAPSMPTLMTSSFSDERETPQSLDMSDDRESLNEMQAAWKEWFETKQEPATESFEQEVTREPQREPERAYARPEAAPEAVEEATPVLVHRIPERPVYVDPPKQIVQAPVRPAVIYPAERAVIREERVRRGSRRPTNLIHAALTVVVVGVVIAIGFIGSGFADTYMGNNTIVEYLGGVSSVNK